MGDLIDQLIELARQEDIGDGDHTTLSSIPTDAKGKAKLLIKESGVLAGVEIAKRVFEKFDPSLVLEIFLTDGLDIKEGDVVFIVSGRIHSLLQAERLVLNIMQRMSGIATLTKTYKNQLKGTQAQILDTRKTTPGLRFLEKDAVCIGGGVNHRIGLFDMILLKDNHVDFAGGISNAINGAKRYLESHNKQLDIEIEVRNFEELNEALAVGGVSRIMLDNFNVEDTRKAVEIVSGKVPLESSGGINLDTIRDYALCGVDYISVGALTNSAKNLDMSLKAIRE